MTSVPCPRGSHSAASSVGDSALSLGRRSRFSHPSGVAGRARAHDCCVHRAARLLTQCQRYNSADRHADIMNLPRSRCQLVIALLSITIAARTSASTEPAFDQQRPPPFWQFVLRESVFKTLSTPRHRDDEDDDLYRKLLEAPFYGGRSVAAAAVASDVEAVVSRGNVYGTPDGRWILCQEGCTRCEPCEWRRDEPAVTWTLRRVRRRTSLGTPKWDMRLTVVPKMDERRSRGRYDRAYATSSRDRKADSHGARDSAPATSRQNFAFGKLPQQTNFESSNGAKGYSNGDQANVSVGTFHGNYRGGSGRRVKRYRSRRRPTSDSYEDVRVVGRSVELPEDDMNPRLIVGIDQNGKKHLVHLVPVDSTLSELNEPNYDANYRPTYRRENVARISRKIPERDASLYEKLIERIVDSFDTHRNFVEKFLYSDRLESEDRGESPGLSPYSVYPESKGEDFDGRNLEGYRIDDSRQVNQYPSGAGEAEGEELRRYPDLTQAVNKPYGEYQDQNAMIEHEPYGVSDAGQNQQQQPQQHQNERFLTLADVERKRRNSFAKLMDPTVGHQALSQNHTQTDASDAELPAKRDFPENSANQALANSQPKINVTDTRMTR